MLSEQDTKFQGDVSLAECLKTLEHPYNLFRYFVDDDLVDQIIDQTCLYSIQNNPNKPYQLTKAQFLKFLGILVITSVAKLSNIRDYWHPVLGNALSRKQ